MLVFETECVKLEGWAAVPVMRLDQRSAAAGIAADRADRDRVIGRDEPGLDERPQQTDGAGRVTAGIGDFARPRDLSGLIGRHFRKAIGPFRMDPVSGAGVEQLRCVGAERPGQCNRLSRSIIGQTQHNEIAGCHYVLASRWILALRRGQAAQLYAGYHFEPRSDAEASRASLAIDEHARLIARHSTAAVMTGALTSPTGGSRKMVSISGAGSAALSCDFATALGGFDTYD